MKDMNGQTILLYKRYASGISGRNPDKKGMSVRCLDIRNSQTVEEQLLKLKISCRGGNAGASNPGNKSSRAGAAE